MPSWRDRRRHEVHPTGRAETGGIAGMCVLVIGAFTGFEATAIYAEEARDPCRKVSRATFIAIGFLTVFHAAGCWLIMGAFGADRAVDLAGEAAGPDLLDGV
ncbi:amino acid permease [Streptomyces sp. NPDC008061]|uniref:amino acid permease n=1 Tax=Streptomyces sp. NPDC008061 TaxID=3364805 RepID=UPI0036EEE3F4